MSFVNASKNSFSVKAYVGDEKTLLAFNFSTKDKATNLAGFTIFCQPPGQVPGYFLLNTLQFEDPSKHKQVAGEKPNSTANAPIQKYRWTHYPGTAHQGLSPALGRLHLHGYATLLWGKRFHAGAGLRPECLR